MKPITLHPLSVLAGLALAGVVFLASSAQTAISTVNPGMYGMVPGAWWTYVQLSHDGLSGPNTYLVPGNRRLVITRVTSGFSLTVNGDAQFTWNRLQAVVNDGGQNTRVVLQPNDLVTGSGQIWGYLEPL